MERLPGPTRPDRLTIWPFESDGFGVDVEWRGAAGNQRATVVRGLLEEAGIRHRLRQVLDGRTWITCLNGRRSRPSPQASMVTCRHACNH